MRPRHNQQRDLFAEEDRKTPPEIPSAQRSVLLQLLENLLTEAVAEEREETRVQPRDDGDRT